LPELFGIKKQCQTWHRIMGGRIPWYHHVWHRLWKSCLTKKADKCKIHNHLPSCGKGDLFTCLRCLLLIVQLRQKGFKCYLRRLIYNNNCLFDNSWRTLGPKTFEDDFFEKSIKRVFVRNLTKMAGNLS